MTPIVPKFNPPRALGSSPVCKSSTFYGLLVGLGPDRSPITLLGLGIDVSSVYHDLYPHTVPD